MTIIVWRDGIMAADTQSQTAYDVRMGHGEKLHLLNDGIIGFSGSLMYLKGVLDWARTARRDAPPPKVGDGYAALLATDDHHLYLVEDGGIYELKYDSFRAIGAGSELAYGALYAGVSAQDTVKAVIAASVHCGGDTRYSSYPFSDIKTYDC